MSRLLTIAGGWWKPVAAVALAMLLATWADAAPPPADEAAPPTTTPAVADGPMVEIVALAQFIADEFDLTFADPLDELDFFFAVADLYFRMQRQQRRAEPRPAGGRTTAATRTAGKPALGSLTTVNR